MLMLQSCFGFPRPSPGTSPYGYNNRCFLVALWYMIVSRPSFGCSNQEAFLSSGKNTGVVLVPCHAWKWVPAARFGGCNIPKVCRCHLSQWMSSQWGLQKLLYHKISISWTLNLLMNHFSLENYEDSFLVMLLLGFTQCCIQSYFVAAIPVWDPKLRPLHSQKCKN